MRKTSLVNRFLRRGPSAAVLGSAVLIVAIVGVVIALHGPRDNTAALEILLVVAAALLLARNLAASRAAQADDPAVAGFLALFDQADLASVLTDGAGRVLRVSSAALQRMPNAATAEYIGDVFTPVHPGAPAVCYRLLRALVDDRVHAERLAAEEPVELRVRRVASDHVLWSLVPLSQVRLVDAAAAPAPFARIDADGRLLDPNPAMAALPEADLRIIARAALAAVTGNRAYAEVEIGAGGAYALCVFACDGGEALVCAVPRGFAGDEAVDRMLAELPVAVARLSPEGRLRSVNAAARDLLGDAARPGARIDDFLDGLGRPLASRIQEALSGRGGDTTELARGEKDGQDSFLQVALSRFDHGDEVDVLAVLSDATELKTLEQQFVQSQKMQAVGQLAGGVAHDFNNLLTAILGHCDLLMMRVDQSGPDYADLAQIRQNAKRAAGLVRQLLAFSRKQTLQPEAVHVEDALGELAHLLNRLLGERVTLRLKNDAELWPVWIDGQQFEQVIMNIVVNARDAMPDGGEVTLRCYNRALEVDLAKERAVIPAGEYVVLEISDTGVGIRPDRLGHVFEPFYTTKRQGDGTGLGLSTAYGIVKQTGGFIFADSVVGKGTTFTLYLPRMEADKAMAEPPTLTAETRRDLTGSGAILLVEDEAPVRAFAGRALRLRGYRVIEAEDAEQALEILEDRTLEVDLFVSDVVMPGMDGPSWVRIARETRPEVGVVFMSGYAEDVFGRGMEDMADFRFLPKPFSLEDLVEAVKQALQRAEEPAAAL